MKKIIKIMFVLFLMECLFANTACSSTLTNGLSLGNPYVYISKYSLACIEVRVYNSSNETKGCYITGTLEKNGEKVEDFQSTIYYVSSGGSVDVRCATKYVAYNVTGLTYSNVKVHEA